MKKAPKSRYKVCILATSIGGMDHIDEHVNRAVLPVGNKAIISYIIEKFPKQTEFVVALGHKKETVIDYLKLAYPERRFTFVPVRKFSGQEAGPGTSLLACKRHLESPFILATSDTIVVEDIPEPKENWLGIAPVRETERYCTVKIKNNLVIQIDDNKKTDNQFAFIGLAGIHDYKEFFKALEINKRPTAGEFQVSTGFRSLMDKKLVPIGFTWFDTGTPENYKETDRSFSGESKFDFSKTNEFLYFVNDRVIKFFADHTVTDKRHQRTKKGLKNLTPKIEAKRGGFYSYKKIEGHTLYSVLNAKLTEEFLEWAKTYLWKKLKLTSTKKKEFESVVKKFYKEKTRERVEAFEKKYGKEEPKIINGVMVPRVRELLDKIDWDELVAGIPSNFHGDLQFDNILVRPGAKKLKDKFVLLDWRHEFGELTHVGDLYYDLAKLYGGMIVSYPLVKEGMFSAETSGDEGHYHYFIKNDILEARDHYEEFIEREGFNLRKIKILTAIIFLNMAPLHHSSFDKMLHHLGRGMLHKAL